jgi:CubicO group peptidase (beta-lactamase class C family)
MKLSRIATLLTLLPVLYAADPGRLKLIGERLRELTDKGTVSGAVALVAHRGEIVSLTAAGWQDIESRKPMRADTIVQVMSQTKSFTAVAAMMLVEEGRLELQRPVEYYLPEFKGQTLQGGSAPKHPPTVWNLLSHTAGLPFLPAAGPYARINYTMDATLSDAVRAYGREPLTAEPGERYFYSNMGIATVGRIIEVISGREYSQFVRERILEPLGMRDSFYFPPEDKRGRIAMVYTHEEGKLVLAREKAQAGDPARYRAGGRYSGPELALYSTAPDLYRFYQMLANGGVYAGRRYLSPQTIRAMTEDLTPAHNGYGLGFSVKTGPAALNNLLPAGTFGHGGAFGTAGFVDPASHLVMIFLTQMNDSSSGAGRTAVFQIAESAVCPD